MAVKLALRKKKKLVLQFFLFYPVRSRPGKLLVHVHFGSHHAHSQSSQLAEIRGRKLSFVALSTIGASVTHNFFSFISFLTDTHIDRASFSEGQGHRAALCITTKPTKTKITAAGFHFFYRITFELTGLRVYSV